MPERMPLSVHHEPVVTSTGFLFEDGDGIVQLLSPPDERTPATAVNLRTALQTIVQDRPFWLLVHFLPGATLPAPAFQMLMGSPVMRQVQAIATVGDAHHEVMIRSHREQIGPPWYAHRFFTSRLDAHAWLLEMKAARTGVGRG